MKINCVSIQVADKSTCNLKLETCNLCKCLGFFDSSGIHSTPRIKC
jgi:hypothetical protein